MEDCGGAVENFCSSTATSLALASLFSRSEEVFSSFLASVIIAMYHMYILSCTSLYHRTCKLHSSCLSEEQQSAP